MIDTMLLRKNIGIVGSLIFYMKDTSKLWFAGGRIDLDQGEFLHEYALSNDHKMKAFETGYVTGCCLLISSKLFTNLSGFDKDFGSYVEDVDLNYRVKKLGLKIVIEPQAKIFHRVSASSGGDFSSTKEFLKSRNAVLFARKNLLSKTKYIFIINYLAKRLTQSITFIRWGQYHLVTASVGGFFSGFFVSLK
jgi:GT2 family glycosyltransferase